MNHDRKNRNDSYAEKLQEPARGKRIALRMIWALPSISRAELSRRIGINRSSITDIITPLISKGIIAENPLERDNHTDIGRPPIGLSFESANDFFIGVNLGVKHSQIGYATLDSEFTMGEEFETPQIPQEAIELIAAKIKKLWGSVESRQLRTIGITVPGPADTERKSLAFAPHLNWENIEIAGALTKLLGLHSAGIPIVVENNAAASAMYEVRLKLPVDKSLRDYTVVRSGSGIGVGLVFDGEVYRGTGGGRGFAGEFGHMTIKTGGKSCICGNRGCWEQYASAPAATARYQKGLKGSANRPPIRFIDLARKAAAGEILAQQVLERTGEYLGIGIANIVMGFGVSNVIVSGRLVYGWKFLQEPIKRAINRSIVGRLKNCSVTSGEPSGASLGGALEIAVDEFFHRL